MRTLARRSAIPVKLGPIVDRRLPEPIEVAAYYVVSEALANATKHANASRVDVDASAQVSRLRLSIRDDGVGGAEPAAGSSLVGLGDRVEDVVVQLPLELDLAVEESRDTGSSRVPARR